MACRVVFSAAFLARSSDLPMILTRSPEMPFS
jgi:hypothetical protein